eukprot:4737733-Prymnesium_polylepis.1
MGSRAPHCAQRRRGGRRRGRQSTRRSAQRVVGPSALPRRLECPLAPARAPQPSWLRAAQTAPAPAAPAAPAELAAPAEPAAPAALAAPAETAAPAAPAETAAARLAEEQAEQMAEQWLRLSNGRRIRHRHLNHERGTWEAAAWHGALAQLAS